MKKKILFLSIAITTSILLFAQKQEKIYYDKDWKGCSKSKAEFYRIVNYDENGNPIGKIVDYFITGELQAEIEGALNIDKVDESKSKYFGLTTGFYKSGEKQFERIYDTQGNIITSKSWYKNGQPNRYREYKDGYLNGKTKEWNEEGQLKLDIDYKNGEIDGKLLSYWANGQINVDADFKNGTSDGKFLIYWNNGNLKRNDEYQNGKLISGKCFNIDGEEIPYFDYEIYPKFIGGETELAQFISKNIIYPKKAKKKGIAGKVLVRFAIDIDGSISDVDIMQGADKSLNKEAIRVVKSMPNWTPGMQDGKAVKCYFALPINFSL